MGYVKISQGGQTVFAAGDNIPPDEHTMADGDLDHHETGQLRKPRDSQFMAPGIQPAQPLSDYWKEVYRLAGHPPQERKARADYWRGKIAEMNDGKRTINVSELLEASRELNKSTDAELIAIQLLQRNYRDAAE